MPQDLGHLTSETASPGHQQPAGKQNRGLEASREGGTREPLRGAPERSEGALCRPPLPCPPKSNNSIEKLAFPPAAGRTAYALSVNVAAAVERWGIKNSGFLTLTFADHVLDPKEAQRRLNSLTTNVLRPRYG